MDDEFTLSHEKQNEYLFKSFFFQNNQLYCSTKKNEKIPNNNNDYLPINTIEKIEITNQKRNPSKVVLNYKKNDYNNFEGKNLNFNLNLENNVLTIKNPNAKISDD